MNYLILILIAFNFNALANDKCKIVGELAKEVMTKRQVQPDVFKLLSLYKENQAMVFDAYEVPMYDAMPHLSNSVNASSRIVAADERRKFNEVQEKYEQSIAQFKLKYIKLCFLSK